MFHLPGPCGSSQASAGEQSEVEECDHFLSFAKRSRTVQRQCNVEAHPCPSFLQSKASAQYNQECWDRILQWPSSLQAEGCATGATGLVPDLFVHWLLSQHVSRAAERRPSLGLRRGQGAALGKDSLPSPSELIRRRRGRGGRGGGAQRGDVMQKGVATVLQHISELKRRQRSIDQLKTERCWGFMAGSGLEDVGVARHGDLLQDPRPPEFSPSQGWEPSTGPTPFTTNLPLYNQQSLQMLEDGRGSEVVQSLATGENPMMSFVMATADRQSHGGGCSPRLPHAEFWGFGFGSEE